MIGMQSATMAEELANSTKAPIEHRFNPYEDNGGSIIGIAGDDFVVLAGDTRNSTGYSINTRYRPQVHEIGDNMVASATGFTADSDALLQRLKSRIEWYHHSHNKPLKVASAARLTQTLLYSHRFFPYYVGTIIAGIDPEGRGAIYSFDPVGSYERQTCHAGGSAASLVTPFLDNQVDFKNQRDPATGEPLKQVNLPLDTVIRIIKDAFTSATERQIQVGDFLEIVVVKKDEISKQLFPLKKD